MIDHDEVVFRDLEIGRSFTFAQLHEFIQDAFGFDNSQMASFYVSNEDWEKGQEITLMDMGEKTESGEPILMMHDTLLKDVIFEAGQKLLYVFDFFLMWCFFLDVVEVKKLDETVIVPRIVQSFGEAPDQYDKSPDLSFETQEALTYDDDDDDEIGEMFDMFGMNDEYSEDREF